VAISAFKKATQTKKPKKEKKKGTANGARKVGSKQLFFEERLKLYPKF
jgi:hypothetical protein